MKPPAALLLVYLCLGGLLSTCAASNHYCNCIYLLASYILLLVTVSVKLLDFTAMSRVPEGQYACTVKHGKCWVLWRVGNITDERGVSDRHLNDTCLTAVLYSDVDQELEGKYSGVGITVRIGILARPQLLSSV